MCKAKTTALTARFALNLHDYTPTSSLLISLLQNRRRETQAQSVWNPSTQHAAGSRG